MVAGIPARVIGSFDEYVEKMKVQQYPQELRPRRQTVSDELAAYLWDKFDQEHASE